MTDLVIGADIGGTSTRVAVADLEGRVLSLASGGPGNPNSVGVSAAAAQINSVLHNTLDRLAGVDSAGGEDEAGGRDVAAGVVAVVIGMAGGSRVAGDPGFWRAALPTSIRVPPILVSDLAVAFCSATTARAGYVIVAGTGAVAGQVIGDGLVQQRDGWGWLLGDQGSGFWLGRAAVRATLTALQRGMPLGPLQQSVLTTSGAGGYIDLLDVCYSASPVGLARFATLVSRHAAEDPLAARIADRAADLLAEALLSLAPQADQPVVRGGSVLTEDGAVRARFLALVAERLPNQILAANPGVVGALWIGSRDRVRDDGPVHARLVSTIAGRT